MFVSHTFIHEYVPRKRRGSAKESNIYEYNLNALKYEHQI